MTAENIQGGRTRPSGGKRTPLHPSVSWSEGTVRLHDPHLFASPYAKTCRSFLRRIFGLKEVRSVEIDGRRGMASIRYAPEGLEIGVVLDRMAAALRGEHARDEDVALGPIPSPGGDPCTVKLSRYGESLSTWEVVHELPGRVRFRHEELRSDGELARRVLQELAAVHGVEACQVKPLTASLLVHFDPAAIDTRQLLQVLDTLLHGSAPWLACEGDPPPVRFGLPNTSVGLAAVGELALPALLPASAVLLVASNVKTFKGAWHEVRRREFGLPVLYTAIIVGTLSSGQFLAAALMSWMLRFWRRQHREELLATRRRLLPGVAQHRRFARLCVGDAVVEVPLDRLRPGDLISALSGEMISADGRVVLGHAVVDERLIRGVDGLTRKAAGDLAFAGSRVAEGEIRLEVTGVGPSTRSATLARAILAATAPSPTPMAVTDHGETFARRAVVPTLATAGLGLMVGDLTTAAAVLRPDYATGPGLGVSLARLGDVADCACEGILVRDASAFERLAEVDMILFDHHPALERARLEVAAVSALDGLPEDAVLRYAATAFRDLAGERARALRAACEARDVRPLDIRPGYLGPGILFHHEARFISVEDENQDGESPLTVSADGRAVGRVVFRLESRPEAAALVRDLRRDHSLAVGLLSCRPGPWAEELAKALGVDLHRGDAAPDAKAVVVRSLRERGTKVAYIGDCRREPRASLEAHVAISLADDFDPENDPAPIVLLPGDLSRLHGLMALARSHVSRVRAVHGSTLIPNLACVAGAFFLGFTSLSSVVITNLGTLSVYSRLTHRARPRRDPSLMREPAGANGRPSSGPRSGSEGRSRPSPDREKEIPCPKFL